MNVYAYYNYRKYLQDYYEYRKSVQRYFSYRSFAKKAGYSYNGKRMKLDDIRQASEVIREVTAEVESGRKFIVFPSLLKASAANACRARRVLASIVYSQTRIESFEP